MQHCLEMEYIAILFFWLSKEAVYFWTKPACNRLSGRFTASIHHATGVIQVKQYGKKGGSLKTNNSKNRAFKVRPLNRCFRGTAAVVKDLVEHDGR